MHIHMIIEIPFSCTFPGKVRKTDILRISKFNYVLAVEGRNIIPYSSHPRIVSSRGLTGKGVSKLVRGHGTLMLEQKEVR